jgi:hypothetical protein
MIRCRAMFPRLVAAPLHRHAVYLTVQAHDLSSQRGNIAPCFGIDVPQQYVDVG